MKSPNTLLDFRRKSYMHELNIFLRRDIRTNKLMQFIGKNGNISIKQTFKFFSKIIANIFMTRNSIRAIFNSMIVLTKKNFEFQSPSLSQFSRDFCLKMFSCLAC